MPIKVAPTDFVDEPTAAPAGPRGIRVQPGDFIDEGPVAEVEKPSQLESGVRGAVQGATLEWGDEIVGLGKALFDNIGGDSHSFAGKYRRARDSERAANKAAQDANPWTYGAGNLAGSVGTSFIPGLGIAKGASVLKGAVGAAKLGAVAGLGGSESEDTLGQVADAAKGAAISGATAGLVGKFMKGAPERVVKRAIGDVTDGATATMRDKVVGSAGDRRADVLSVIKEKSFKRAGRDPEKQLESVEAALRDAGSRLDEAYARAGAKTPGIKVSEVLGRLEGIAQRLAKDPGKADLARAVKAKTDDVLEAWGNQTHVPAQDVRVLASDIADAAFRGSPAVAPKAGQSASRDVWGALKGLIDDNMEAAGQGGSKELAALNKRMSTLMNIREAVNYRATRGATQSTRLRDVMSNTVDLGLIATSPTAFIGKKAVEHVGAPLGRLADEQLATLVTAAANGNKKAKLAERAIQLGVSPLVAQALAVWAQDQAEDLNGAR